jgi:ABC-2 type transport system permease protein
MAFPSLFQGQSDSEFMNTIASFIQNVGGFVLPLTWLAKGVYLSGIGYYFLFVLTSVFVFAVFALVVGRFYKTICSGLSSNATKGRYSVGEMKAQSALFALYKRELKGYVSSSLYFMNTAIGYALAVVLAISVGFIGVEAVFTGLGIYGKIIKEIIPFIFAITLCLMPSTACAISIEGKGWDLTKSLPVPAKTVMDAKLLTFYTFALPCAVIGEIALLIALKPVGGALLSTMVAPLVVMLFAGVAGLFVNVKFPVFDWDNEAQVVKQSSSALISMLVCFVSGGIPALLKIAVPESVFVWGLLAYLIVLVGVGIVLYQKLITISLNSIDKK